jgi:hypothetical protein
MTTANRVWLIRNFIHNTHCTLLEIKTGELRSRPFLLSEKCRSMGKIWGNIGGFTTNIPPYTLSTTEILKDLSFV